MGTGMISTGLTGIQVAQLGLLTTEHNIANASTEGYNRQQTIQATNIAVLTGSGYVGQGAHVQTISRMYSSFLSTQVNRTQTTSSELESYYSQITQIDNMLAAANSGVSTALQSFFSGIQDVAANPSELSARQALVSSAQALVARYQGLESRISDMYEAVNDQIVSSVATINSYSQQIAALNESIVIARSATNQEPNDLLDQRDQLVLELNKLVRVTTTENSDGTFNVYVGNGQQLVVGSQVMKLTAQPSAADPTKFVVGLATLGGTQELPESLITGGSLGGLLTFRSEALDKAANDLGNNAASLALVYNAQNALGQDLLGQSAGDRNFVSDFFTISQPKVYANTNNGGTATVYATFSEPSIDGVYSLTQDATGYLLTRQSDGKTWHGDDMVALGSLAWNEIGIDVSSASVPSDVYGADAIDGNFYTKLTGSDYRLYSNGPDDFTITRLSDNKQWSGSLEDVSAAMESSEGFSLSVDAGAFATGDSFIIKPTADVARNVAVSSSVAADVRLIAAAMPIRTSADGDNTGNGTITAGSSVFGFGDPEFPTSGVTLTYDGSTSPATLVVSGVPVGTSVSVTVGDSTDVYGVPNTDTDGDGVNDAIGFTYTSGATIAFAGVSLAISGSLNTGDKFTVENNASGVADGRNALALGQLQAQNTMAGKTTSFQGAYAQLVSDVGNKTREIEVKSDAQTALLQQSTDARDSLSGVNLDEEAANLLRYQQAYQASAKMIEVGNKLFDVLLSAAAG